MVVREVVEHAHHARMVEMGEQAGLDLELGRVAPFEHPLERNRPAALHFASSVDGAHPTCRDGCLYLVEADPAAGVQASRRGL